MLQISLAITAFAWSGFMTLYGYLANRYASPATVKSLLLGYLVIVGVGLIIGNIRAALFR